MILNLYCGCLFGENEKVKEVMFKEKMICLYTSSESSEARVTRFIRNVMMELRDNIHMIYLPHFNWKGKSTVDFTRTLFALHITWKEPQVPPIEGMSMLSLCEHEAMRFWARIYSLKECINGMDDNDKHLDGIKELLYFIDQEYSLNSGINSMVLGIMDEDGNLVTTLGKETLENPKDKEKKLMKLIQELIKCPKKGREKTLAELEQLRSSVPKNAE